MVSTPRVAFIYDYDDDDDTVKKFCMLYTVKIVWQGPLNLA